MLIGLFERSMTGQAAAVNVPFIPQVSMRFQSGPLARGRECPVQFRQVMGGKTDIKRGAILTDMLGLDRLRDDDDLLLLQQSGERRLRRGDVMI